MNDDSETLRNTYPATFAEVRRYLLNDVHAVEIVDREDFDRDAISFRITLPSSRRVRVLVSHEFLSDFTAKEAAKLLKQWRVGSKASALARSQMLVVTTTGTLLESIADDPHLKGPTLRESAALFGAAIETSGAVADLQERVFNVPVNGTSLGDIPSRFAGPSEYYSRYSDEFADLVGSAYLLDAAGLRGFTLDRVPLIPGLRVNLVDGSHIFLEFSRVEPDRERHAADVREYINGALRRLSYTDPALPKAMDGYFISVSLPDIDVGKDQRLLLIEEIASFVKGGFTRTAPKQSIEQFDKEDFPALARLGATVYVAEGPTSLSVQEAAKSFDPYAPIQMIAAIVRTKSNIPYTASPIWLGVSLAEYVAVVPVNVMDLRRFPEVDIGKTPFEKIIVGSAGALLRVCDRDR
jgi:hypothetical protein